MNKPSLLSSWLYVSTKICGWLFAGLTVLWLGVAAVFWVGCIGLQHDGTKAEATVTKVVEEESERGKFKYSYFTFTDTESGKEYTVKSQMAATERPLYDMGSKVEVIYPAGRPDVAEENIFIIQYLVPLIFTFFVFVTGFISLVSFLICRKMHKKQTNN